MCFNGAKLWQLGWFTGDDALLVSDTDLSTPLGITLEGFVHPLSSSDGKPKVVKINGPTANDLFVVFNWASLHNSGTREAANLVTIVEQGAEGNAYSPSSLVAKLNVGGTYTRPGYFGTLDLSVTVNSINTSSGEATITIGTAGVSNPMKKCARVNKCLDFEPNIVPFAVVTGMRKRRRMFRWSCLQWRRSVLGRCLPSGDTDLLSKLRVWKATSLLGTHWHLCG